MTCWRSYSKGQRKQWPGHYHCLVRSTASHRRNEICFKTGVVENYTISEVNFFSLIFTVNKEFSRGYSCLSFHFHHSTNRYLIKKHPQLRPWQRAALPFLHAEASAGILLSAIGTASPPKFMSSHKGIAYFSADFFSYMWGLCSKLCKPSASPTPICFHLLSPSHLSHVFFHMLLLAWRYLCLVCTMVLP